MASERQVAFFKSLYDEESKRTGDLNEHAKTILTLVTLYSGFNIFVLSQAKQDNVTIKSVIILSIICMLGAFLLSLYATQISIFDGLNKPSDILKTMGKTQPNDDEFFDSRIVDYTVAYERNSEVNDKKANWLSAARYFLLLGIALQAGYFALRVLLSRGELC